MPECTLCGHEGHEYDGGRSFSGGAWYCEICRDNAPSGETPDRTYTTESIEE